jgi:hypothetical protein
VISSWVLKIALVIAVIGFAVIEVGSPLVVRVSLDSSAHETADDAAQEFTHTRSPEKAQAVAQEDADREHAQLQKFDIDAQGIVRVTLFKQAKSYVLHNFEQTRSWYDVRVNASAASH